VRSYRSSSSSSSKGCSCGGSPLAVGPYCRQGRCTYSSCLPALPACLLLLLTFTCPPACLPACCAAGTFTRGEDGLWDTPEAARWILTSLLDSHAAQLADLKTASGQPLSSLVEEGLDKAAKPSAVVAAAIAAKEAVAGVKEVPTLIAVDDYNVLYSHTGYYESVHNFHRRQLAPDELRLVRQPSSAPNEAAGRGGVCGSVGRAGWSWEATCLGGHLDIPFGDAGIAACLLDSKPSLALSPITRNQPHHFQFRCKPSACWSSPRPPMAWQWRLPRLEAPSPPACGCRGPRPQASTCLATRCLKWRQLQTISLTA
jgi:hypothetical protein